MTPFAQAETDFQAAKEAYDLAQSRLRNHETVVIVVAEAARDAALEANEVSLDQMAIASAEDEDYLGNPLIDISRIDGDINQLERILAKMKDAAKVKGGAMTAAHELFKTAERDALKSALAGYGVRYGDRLDADTIVKLTVSQLIEIEAITSRLAGRHPSLSNLADLIVVRDFDVHAAVEAAFERARK